MLKIQICTKLFAKFENLREFILPKPHFYAFFDKKGRMMGVACHNTDIGDGWEEEGATPWYFKYF